MTVGVDEAMLAAPGRDFAAGDAVELKPDRDGVLGMDEIEEGQRRSGAAERPRSALKAALA